MDDTYVEPDEIYQELECFDMHEPDALGYIQCSAYYKDEFYSFLIHPDGIWPDDIRFAFSRLLCARLACAH